MARELFIMAKLAREGQVTHATRAKHSATPTTSTMARRLHFNGSVISAPETPTVPLFLRGFNMDYQLGHSDLHMPNVTAQDRSMTTLLPGTTVVRLVMVHWHDEGTTKSGHDCSSDDPSTGYLREVCLQQFDSVLRWATQEAGLWAIVTMRASLAAGDGGVNQTLFDNATLASQAAGLWSFLASRYRSWSNIAGYEVLSEPRTEQPASVVHAYHKQACDAVWASDPLAACVIGPTKFYDRYNLSPEYLLPGRVIYAANFFEPKAWINDDGTAASVPYGATARCCDLAEAKSCGGSCGPGGGGGDINVTLGKAWLSQLLEPALAFQRAHGVPVYVDQWALNAEASVGEADRVAYLDDVLALFGDGGLHWSWWIWRSGYDVCPRSSAIYCGPSPNGSYTRFETAVARLARWLGPAP